VVEAAAHSKGADEDARHAAGGKKLAQKENNAAQAHGQIGAILGHFGVNLAILGCHLGGFGGCPTRFGVLGVNLAILGCHLGRFEGSPTRFGGVLWAGKARQHGLQIVLGRVFRVWGPGGNQTRELQIKDLWICG
jgi:hypothetical protein